jgi:hypothetical protein
MGLLPSVALVTHPIKNNFKKEFNKKGRRRKFEPMIDYKYPTIASGATPIGSAGRALDEELLWKERGRKFRVHGLNIYSHRESKFKNPMISAIALAKSKIEEVKV